MAKEPQLRSVEKQPFESKQGNLDELLTFIDLRDSYDERLLRRFYSGLMRSNFPMEDELEPLEVWMNRLDPKTAAEHSWGHDFHALLALDEDCKDSKDPVIAGALVFQYFQRSNTALYAYMVIDPAYRRRGLITILVNRSIPILHRGAQHHGHRQCDLFVAETNATGVEDGVLKSTDRHKVMTSLGFGHLDVKYVQPPYSKVQDPVYDLVLIAHKSSPALTTNPEGKKVVPSALIKGYMTDFAWVCNGGKDDLSYQDAVFFKHAMKQFEGVTTTAWNPSLPWPGPHPAPPGALKFKKPHPEDKSAEVVPQQAIPQAGSAVIEPSPLPMTPMKENRVEPQVLHIAKEIVVKPIVPELPAIVIAKPGISESKDVKILRSPDSVTIASVPSGEPPSNSHDDNDGSDNDGSDEGSPGSSPKPQLSSTPPESLPSLSL